MVYKTAFDGHNIAVINQSFNIKLPLDLHITKARYYVAKDHGALIWIDNTEVEDEILKRCNKDITQLNPVIFYKCTKRERLWH